VNVPALPLHDSVEVPEPVTLVGVRVHVRPVAGDMLAVSETTPLKPFRAVMVIVEVPGAPPRIVTVVGLAAIVKSWTVKVTVAECEREPLVPTTVTMYVPAVPLHDNVLVPEPVTLVGDRVQVRPVAGETVADSDTTPLNPCRPVIVIVEVPVWPARTVTLVGLADIVKSCTVNVTLAL
jgi:hypothetical protein